VRPTSRRVHSRRTGGQALPFVEDGVSIDARLHRAAATAGGLSSLCRGLIPDALYDLAFALQAAAGAAVAIKRANRGGRRCARLHRGQSHERVLT
jgi:mannose/cellobiose epimerase-like protein (N-acyl-D-glucosamine 2-epimerase family)